MAVNHIIECCSRDLVPEYCQGLETSAIYTATHFFVEFGHVRSHSSLPRLQWHMRLDEIIPTFLMWNIYIGLGLLKALTLTRLRSYEMFKGLLIVRMNKSMGLRGILNFRLL